jgi:hypothetical protein
MSYDLKRLRLHGLIHRLPRTNAYQLTSEGIRVAVFYTNSRTGSCVHVLDANKPPARIEIRRSRPSNTPSPNTSKTPASHPP